MIPAPGTGHVCGLSGCLALWLLCVEGSEFGVGRHPAALSFGKPEARVSVYRRAKFLEFGCGALWCVCQCLLWVSQCQDVKDQGVPSSGDPSLSGSGGGVSRSRGVLRSVGVAVQECFCVASICGAVQPGCRGARQAGSDS